VQGLQGYDVVCVVVICRAIPRVAGQFRDECVPGSLADIAVNMLQRIHHDDDCRSRILSVTGIRHHRTSANRSRRGHIRGCSRPAVTDDHIAQQQRRAQPWRRLRLRRQCEAVPVMRQRRRCRRNLPPPQPLPPASSPSSPHLSGRCQPAAAWPPPAGPSSVQGSQIRQVGAALSPPLIPPRGARRSPGSRRAGGSSSRSCQATAGLRAGSRSRSRGQAASAPCWRPSRGAAAAAEA
jgi:hypothetical protein